jgi:hypothetical protein
MNHEQNLDEIVARWVDDGPEVAPERFVWAALDAVEHSPQRHGWLLTLENAPMFKKVVLPVLGVAAVILVAVIALQQLNAGPEPGGEPSTTPEASAEASAEASPSAVAATCGLAVAATDRVAVTMCTSRGGSDDRVVSFTLDGPASMVDQFYNSGEVMYLFPPVGGNLISALSGPDTVDEWLAYYTDEPSFEVTAPTPVTIDGVDGFVLDVTLAAGVAAGDAPPVIEDIELPLSLQEGGTARVWILDNPDEALAFAVYGSNAEFPARADAGDDMVASIVRGP